jgi:hypothetical protein
MFVPGDRSIDDHPQGEIIMGEGQGVTVDLGALTTFAKAMSSLHDGNEAQAKARGMELDLIAGLIATPAISEFSEASAFAEYHHRITKAAQYFMSDLIAGAASLGYGAETCAIRYASTDQFNANMLKQISDNPKGLATFDVTLTGKGAVSSTDVDSAFNPDDKSALYKANSGATDPTQAPATGKGADPAKVTQDFDAQVKKDVTDLQNGQGIDKGSQADGGSDMKIGTDPYQVTIRHDETPIQQPG